MFKKIIRLFPTAVLLAVTFVFPAMAQNGRVGMAKEGQINFQPAATDVMQDIINLHTSIFYLVTVITIFVTLLLIWIFVRYNKRANKTPSKITHHTGLEIVWTVIPIVILAVIAVPSIKLLYKQDVIPESDLLIKVTGHQWYWTYEYPDQGITFDANMVPDDYALGTANQFTTEDWDSRFDELRIILGLDQAIQPKRLLDTDTRLVVPVDTTVKVLVTADDVLHSWTIPAFGFKIDAVPGQINETWFHVNEVGTYYGQCSELCGIKHAFMPTVVEVVSKAEFEQWLTRANSFYAQSQPIEEVAKLAAQETEE